MRAPLAPASRLLRSPYVKALLPFFFAFGCQKHEVAAANEPSIRLGLLPHVDAATELREQAPFAVYLEGATGAHVDMNIGKSYASMVDAICGGEDDVVQLGGLTYLQAAERCGVVPIVQRDVDQTFHSLFITAADSPIHALKDLAGHSFAFGSPDSASGHLMPAYFMAKEGVDPAVTARAVYSGGHDKTAAQVAAKKVDAGALSE
ncbi:MAG TPA: phosphate/phosphite/phosphonate ABC transporter substrate-binding protein, partial [Polyangiaceae bacterium]